MFELIFTATAPVALAYGAGGAVRLCGRCHGELWIDHSIFQTDGHWLRNEARCRLAPVLLPVYQGHGPITVSDCKPPNR
jgi:hypothetical protein